MSDENSVHFNAQWSYEMKTLDKFVTIWVLIVYAGVINFFK